MPLRPYRSTRAGSHSTQFICIANNCDRNYPLEIESDLDSNRSRSRRRRGYRIKRHGGERRDDNTTIPHKRGSRLLWSSTYATS